MPLHRRRYNAKGWVLGICTRCGRGNFVEPHGMTAKCKCSPEWTEHVPAPYPGRLAGGDLAGLVPSARERAAWLTCHNAPGSACYCGLHRDYRAELEQEARQ